MDSHIVQNIRLTSPELINVTDSTGLEYFGCNQEWYGSYWQRLSGCGPSVATTLLLYLQRTGKVYFPVSGYDRNDCVRLMDNVWPHVTPTMRGVNTSDIFCNGIQSFAAANQFTIHCDRLIIPKAKHKRPDVTAALAFIADGLRADSPIAFLNLHNGSVKTLEAWHWVTIVAIDLNVELREGIVTIFDGDKADRIDFSRWYESTSKGGALVYLKTAEDAGAD